MMILLIIGSPIDGFAYWGPFNNSDDAVAYAEKLKPDQPWWIVLLNNPT